MATKANAKGFQNQTGLPNELLSLSAGGKSNFLPWKERLFDFVLNAGGDIGEYGYSLLQKDQESEEKRFDKEFVELARSVYITNDKRCEVKKIINLMTSSGLVEEKSYKEY